MKKLTILTLLLFSAVFFAQDNPFENTKWKLKSQKDGHLVYQEIQVVNSDKEVTLEFEDDFENSAGNSCQSSYGSLYFENNLVTFSETIGTANAEKCTKPDIPSGQYEFEAKDGQLHLKLIDPDHYVESVEAAADAADAAYAAANAAEAIEYSVVTSEAVGILQNTVWKIVKSPDNGIFVLDRQRSDYKASKNSKETVLIFKDDNQYELSNNCSAEMGAYTEVNEQACLHLEKGIVAGVDDCNTNFPTGYFQYEVKDDKLTLYIISEQDYQNMTGSDY